MKVKNIAQKSFICSIFIFLASLLFLDFFANPKIKNGTVSPFEIYYLSYIKFEYDNNKQSKYIDILEQRREMFDSRPCDLIILRPEVVRIKGYGRQFILGCKMDHLNEKQKKIIREKFKTISIPRLTGSYSLFPKNNPWSIPIVRNLVFNQLKLLNVNKILINTVRIESTRKINGILFHEFYQVNLPYLLFKKHFRNPLYFDKKQ